MFNKSRLVPMSLVAKFSFMRIKVALSLRKVLHYNDCPQTKTKVSILSTFSFETETNRHGSPLPEDDLDE